MGKMAKTISDSLDGPRSYAPWTVASLVGVLLAIISMHFVGTDTSNSHALAPYVSGFCSKYVLPPGGGQGQRSGTNKSIVNAVLSSLPHEDRLAAIEAKLDELVLGIKTLAADTVGIASRLDSENAGTGRSLEELSERLHRVENHVFVSEDLA